MSPGRLRLVSLHLPPQRRPHVPRTEPPTEPPTNSTTEPRTDPTSTRRADRRADRPSRLCLPCTPSKALEIVWQVRTDASTPHAAQ